MIRGYSISEEDIDIVMPFVRGVIHELEVGNATNIELSLLNLGPCQFMDVFINSAMIETMTGILMVGNRIHGIIFLKKVLKDFLCIIADIQEKFLWAFVRRNANGVLL